MKTLEQALSAAGIENYPLAFQTAMAFVLPHEVEFMKGHQGDYDFVRTENVTGDPGGKTKYGVDKKAHPRVNIDALTLEDALAIYWQEWQEHKLDQLPDKLAVAAYDVWVNGGHANVWLQHAYNETNAPTDDEIAEDGNLGPVSLAALKSGDEDEILRVFLEQRQERFERLAKRPDLAQFLGGWTNRNKHLAELLA